MRNKIIKIFLVILILCFLVLLGYIVYNKYKINLENKVINDIMSHYNQYVVVNNDTKLYKYVDGNYIEAGEISESINLELEYVESFKSNNIYFEIKDSDYYIFYGDVNVGNKFSYNINEKYLVFNNNIKVNNGIVLNKNNKFVKLNEVVSLPIQYMDDNNYYVIYFNDIYTINRNNEVEIVEVKNIDLKESEFISIIDFSNISIEKLKEYLTYLKENGYYSINIDEYKEWLKANIKLQEKAILFTYDKENNDVLSVINEYGFNIVLNDNLDVKFIDNNETTTKNNKVDSLNRYKITNAFNIEHLKKICNGEKVVIYVPSQNVSTGNLPDADGIATSIPILNYHFFFDPSIGEHCNENLCIDIKNFRQQLDFLKNNGYKTLTIEEFRAWMYGEIELPARSVLITIDDGAMGTGAHNGNKLIPLLEEYDMYATLFLITGWWDVGNYKSDHLDVESHTNNMHTGNLCSNQTRGAQLLCSSKNEVLADLKRSIEVLNSSTAFCFPFYAYNDSAIESIKEVGFKLAFIGGNRKATRNTDKYKIPRYPIYGTTTMNQFANMLK